MLTFLLPLAPMERMIASFAEELKVEEPWWMSYLPVRRMTEEEIEMHAENCRRIEVREFESVRYWV